MGIPTLLFAPLIPIATLYGIFARVGGVGIAALRHHYGGQPYCKMPGAAFGVVYLALGGLSGFLAPIGVCYHYPRKWMNISGRVRGGPPGPIRGVMDPDQLPPDKNWAKQ